MPITDQQLRDLGVPPGSPREAELKRRFARRDFQAATSRVPSITGGTTTFARSGTQAEADARRAGAENTTRIAQEFRTARQTGATLPTPAPTPRVSSSASAVMDTDGAVTRTGSLRELERDVIQSFRPVSFTQRLTEKMQALHDKQFAPLTEARGGLFEELMNLGVSEADAIRANTIRAQIADVDRQLSRNEGRITDLAELAARAGAEDQKIKLATIQSLMSEQKELRAQQASLAKNPVSKIDVSASKLLGRIVDSTGKAIPGYENFNVPSDGRRTSPTGSAQLSPTESRLLNRVLKDDGTFDADEYDLMSSADQKIVNAAYNKFINAGSVDAASFPQIEETPVEPVEPVVFGPPTQAEARGEAFRNVISGFKSPDINLGPLPKSGLASQVNRFIKGFFE